MINPFFFVLAAPARVIVAFMLYSQTVSKVCDRTHWRPLSTLPRVWRFVYFLQTAQPDRGWIENASECSLQERYPSESPPAPLGPSRNSAFGRRVRLAPH